MLQKNWKFVAVISLGVIYFISFWLLTVGYFTPNWLIVYISQSYYDIEWRRFEPYYTSPYWFDSSSCNSIGIVTWSCDYDIYSWFKRRDIHNISSMLLKDVFRLMTTALVVVYTNAALLSVAVVFDLFKSSFYMSLLSISFGVFYPIAAILILVATIYFEALYVRITGFSPIICIIAGGLMLVFYVGLIMYDRHYINKSISTSSKEKKHQTTIQIQGIRQASSIKTELFFLHNKREQKWHQSKT